jgi:hypothetical protein
MKKVIALAALVALAVAAHAHLGEVLASWEVPVPDIYVNGMACDGNSLWLKDTLPENEGIKVIKCTPSGSLLSSFHLVWQGYLPRYGLTFDGTYLWTILQQYLDPLRRDICEKYTTTGSAAAAFCPHPFYWGSIALTSNRGYIYTHFPHKRLIEKYTASGTLVATYAVPVLFISDMAYYNRQLWYLGGGGLVYGVTLNGPVVASFAAPGGSCYAVGFDGEYLWTADRSTPQYIYKVDIDVVDVAPASVGRVKALYR